MRAKGTKAVRVSGVRSCSTGRASRLGKSALSSQSPNGSTPTSVHRRGSSSPKSDGAETRIVVFRNRPRLVAMFCSRLSRCALGERADANAHPCQREDTPAQVTENLRSRPDRICIPGISHMKVAVDLIVVLSSGQWSNQDFKLQGARACPLRGKKEGDFHHCRATVSVSSVPARTLDAASGLGRSSNCAAVASSSTDDLAVAQLVWLYASASRPSSSASCSSGSCVLTFRRRGQPIGSSWPASAAMPR
jgi:hypothetical protein